MSTAFLGTVGYPPQLAIGAGNPEALKYGKLWERPEYRAVAPGELLAQTFLLQAKPRAGSQVIDFGCGTGRGALMLALLGGMRVLMVDFVRNSLDPEIRDALTTQAHALTFLKHDLELPLPVTAEYGYCCDVMEHIPPDKVDQALVNILAAARHVFFSIATEADQCGALIGETLHLSQHPAAWWRAKLTEHGCVFHWAEETGSNYLCYVTAWTDTQKIVDEGVVNTTNDQIRANVKMNIENDWQQVIPHPTNDLECMIVGGGPSLPQFEDEIKAKRAAGVKLITLNGAYNWALDNGLTPSATCIVDARPFNARFTKPVVDGCKYLIASQCDPSVLEGLPKDRTYLFHTMSDLIADLLTAHYHDWYPIPGGSTVLLRVIPLMRLLGYRKFHLYGCDSCLSPEQAHHAYAQPENDSVHVIPVMVTGGRVFHCHLWMAAQAQEMMSLIGAIGDEIELEIHGDGLLAHILKTGAEMAIADEQATATPTNGGGSHDGRTSVENLQ